MARNNIFGGNMILDSIQNGLCGNCGGYGYNTPVKEQVVAPISIKTAPQTPTTPAPVQQQTPAQQVQQQVPQAQSQQYVQPSVEAAMYMGSHAYVQALYAQQQAQQNSAQIVANQKLADERYEKQKAFNKEMDEAIEVYGKAITDNAEAIRGLQHRAANAEARAKAQQAEINAAKAELAKLKAQQAQQQDEIAKLKDHNRIQDKRLDNLESNMRKVNAVMQKFGKKK